MNDTSRRLKPRAPTGGGENTFQDSRDDYKNNESKQAKQN
jgi:hypothetical protein